jgi:signal recognition particle subunit SRP14
LLAYHQLENLLELEKMVLLENDQFMTELTKFYQKAKSAGTVIVTMKRYDGRTKPVPRSVKAAVSNPPEPQEYKCLIRANMGSKKLSTVVLAKDLNKFQVAYSNLIRGNIELKKKSDKKTKNNTDSSASKPLKKPAAKSKKQPTSSSAQKMDTQ